jgi:uncharacterized glyoxalase superfamily protein PhnB
VSEATSGSEQRSVAPYFLVHDVVSTASYYRDILGFRFDRFWGESPSFCMVRRGGIVITLAQVEPAVLLRPNNLASREGGAWDAYIWVDDVEALRSELISRGVKVARELCDQPYGCRDLDVLDLNGYRLCFGQDIS